MNILAAVIVGIVANVVFTAVLLMAPKMGLPKMGPDRHAEHHVRRRSSRARLDLHLMMGVVFGLVYGLLLVARSRCANLAVGPGLRRRALAHRGHDHGYDPDDACWHSLGGSGKHRASG